MKTLSNGLKIFNGTPHSITFEVDGVLESVPPDEKIDAKVNEVELGTKTFGANYAVCVTPTFEPTPTGTEIVEKAYAAGADIVVGSIIAAQAYPGLVYAMVPVPGYERVPPAEKRMLPDKFTVFYD